MKEFFASVFEWGGLNPLYSKDLGDHLRGYDITCTDYVATPWYVYIGWFMIISTAFLYALQYHIIDKSTFNKRRHWWLIALCIVLVNFFVAFILPYNTLQSGDYCKQLKLSISDCIGFGFSVALWSLFLFGLISSVPWIRSLSDSCSHTTFWKPKNS